MQQTKNNQLEVTAAGTLDQIIDTRDAVSFEELERFRHAETPEIKRASFETLTEIASGLIKGKATLSPRPVMDLTPRHPYDANGLMDFYQPGRWDCTSDAVYMSGIKIGPSPGQWDGTVGYLQFKAPKNGTYLIVAHFTGFQITMKLGGPWGTSTGTTGTTSEPGTVSAIWTAKAGDQVFPGLTCVYPNLAFLGSVQAYLLS